MTQARVKGWAWALCYDVGEDRWRERFSDQADKKVQIDFRSVLGEAFAEGRK